MAKADDMVHESRKHANCEDEMQGPFKHDRNEIRGMQRKLRRLAAVVDLSEEEIRLYCNYVAAIQIDPLELLAIEDPAERIAHIERQKRRAQYTDLFFDGGRMDAEYVSINSEAYRRIERSQKEILVVKGAIEKIMRALVKGYNEEEENLRRILDQIEEKLKEDGDEEDKDIRAAARVMLRAYSRAV